MKYLVKEKQATQYYFLVHMDETKVSEDGSPNPDYVREYLYPLLPNDKDEKVKPMYNNEKDKQPVTETEYLAKIKTEIGLLVADELARMNPAPTPEATSLEGF